MIGTIPLMLTTLASPSGCSSAPPANTTFLEIGERIGLPSELPAWDALAEDLDQDGLVELVITSHSHASWWEIRDGALTPDPNSPWSIHDGKDRHGQAACDLTGDSRRELVVNTGGAGGAGGHPAEIWTQFEEGWRDLGPSLLPGTASLRGRGVTCTDITRDGRMEVHLSAEAGPDHLATPALPTQASLHIFKNGSQEAHWKDLNGDDRPDLVRIVDERLEIQLQQAGGTLAAPVQPSGVPRVGGLALADLDNDGDLDLYVGGTAGPGQGDLVAPGRLRLRFRSLDIDQVAFSLPSNCRQVTLEVRGRLNGKRAQFSTTTQEPQDTLVLERTETSPPDPSLPLGVWIEKDSLWIRAHARSGQAKMGLRCQDGTLPPVLQAKIDLVPLKHSLQDEILWNNGDGTFQADPTAMGDSSSWDTVDVAPQDFDSDGDLDLFVVMGRRPGTFESAPDLLLENLGNRRFSPSPMFQDTHPTGTAGIARWIDLTGDGRADLLQLPSEYGGPLGARPRAWENP